MSHPRAAATEFGGSDKSADALAQSDRVTEKRAMDVKEAKARRKAALDTPTNLPSNATRDISGALTALLADMFALYVKTKNFHWHVSGPHFRDYHLLLDEQGEQIFSATDDIAERSEERRVGKQARAWWW